MRVDRGSIKVLTADSDKVDIQVIRELMRGSDEESREAYEKHKIEISKDGNSVRVEAENSGGILAGRKASKNLHVEYIVTVPSRFALDLITSGGNVQVANIEGSVKVQSSGGNLKIGTVTGAISGQTSGGNIEMEGGQANAKLQTAGGDIRIGNLEGNLRAKTSGGNIVVSELKGDTDISTTGGEIKLKQADGGVKARTTGGNIKAQLSGVIKADSSLKTTGGNIDLAISDRTAVSLRARTTGGNVKTDFEGDYNKQRTTIVAEINGGGPELSAETTGGNINVRRK